MKAKILHVLCEGQTEEGFVNEVLRPYLQNKGVTSVKSILITTNKKKNARGGMLSYAHAVRNLHILQQTKKDGPHEQHVFTTMFDLYALPDDFPGYDVAQADQDPYERVKTLEKAFAEDINDSRFIPYIQLHEFEALLFCGIKYFPDLYPRCEKRCEPLYKTLQDKGNPELIDNHPETAPSKLIIKAIEGDRKTRYYNYNKPATAKYVAGKVGIDALCARCPHFNEWIIRLTASPAL